MNPNGAVYVNGDFSEPMSAQHNFQNHFDLDHPVQAMHLYNRIMHQHTKRQMEKATDSMRRHSSASNSEGGSLASIGSNHS
ncbi:hypothetical protein L228DRAFT_270417 [Xylona heveae TC161]|uniref:Uncharacterized protein n=1 Tax=Xylona heveae (strain CBS 132557 / TC161) TaxID=1328760 RepID=A0A165AEC9_XYLHT|nr:hypothetical protein L228DRAFT_270417 [Xylona heveae TC161]KZF20338.1 hypothetical protein L228DRAFT_270417 [Xylona heveae TC161]